MVSSSSKQTRTKQISETNLRIISSLLDSALHVLRFRERIRSTVLDLTYKAFTKAAISPAKAIELEKCGRRKPTALLRLGNDRRTAVH